MKLSVLVALCGVVFHATEGFIEPFAELAASDGYQAVAGSSSFTPEYLRSFDIVMVIAALPFEFTSKTEVTTETTFTDLEIEALHGWLLVHQGRAANHRAGHGLCNARRYPGGHGCLSGLPGSD